MGMWKFNYSIVIIERWSTPFIPASHIRTPVEKCRSKEVGVLRV